MALLRTVSLRSAAGSRALISLQSTLVLVHLIHPVSGSSSTAPQPPCTPCRPRSTPAFVAPTALRASRFLASGLCARAPSVARSLCVGDGSSQDSTRPRAKVVELLNRLRSGGETATESGLAEPRKSRKPAVAMSATAGEMKEEVYSEEDESASPDFVDDDVDDESDELADLSKIDLSAIPGWQGLGMEEEEAPYEFEGDKRCGTVAILGAPNAGKSTLLNYLVGSKIAIVTHKRQTTRNSMTGICMNGGTQMIFIDTPGIMDARPSQRLNKAMVKSAWNSARDADEIFFLVDADKVIPGSSAGGRSGKRDRPVHHPVAPEALQFREGSNEELILRRLGERRQRFNVVLNKVDQLKGERKALLLPLAEQIKAGAGLADDGSSMVKKVFAVSAINGRGLDSINSYLRDALPLGDWLYPTDQISNIPLRQIAAELTRETIFLRAHEEVPYSCFVETETFKDQADGSTRIEQTIYVETTGQKKILVGMIKDLGMRSRREMMKLLDRKVHLFLTVKNKKGWTDANAIMYQKLGLDFNA